MINFYFIHFVSVEKSSYDSWFDKTGEDSRKRCGIRCSLYNQITLDSTRNKGDVNSTRKNFFSIRGTKGDGLFSHRLLFFPHRYFSLCRIILLFWISMMTTIAFIFFRGNFSRILFHEAGELYHPLHEYKRLEGDIYVSFYCGSGERK